MGRGLLAISITASSVLAACIAAAQGASAPNNSSAAEAASSRVYTVAVIGDSLSDPKSGGAKYVDLLRSRCPQSRFDTYGRGGTMVNQMRAAFQKDLFGPARPRYTHVVVFGGVNDIGSNETARRTVRKIEDDLATMYTQAHRHGVRVVAVTIAPWGGLRSFHTPERQRMTSTVKPTLPDDSRLAWPCHPDIARPEFESP